MLHFDFTQSYLVNICTHNTPKHEIIHYSPNEACIIVTTKKFPHFGDQNFQKIEKLQNHSILAKFFITNFFKQFPKLTIIKSLFYKIFFH